MVLILSLMFCKFAKNGYKVSEFSLNIFQDQLLREKN